MAATGLQYYATNGVCSMQGLGEELNVATCCGRCSDCARQILDESVACRADSSQQVSIAL
ncbi:MAG: bacterioferritin [Gammaproteobacteria bacterium]|nr:bacterioferritin [Gammaproteobacteria bacterium]